MVAAGRVPEHRLAVQWLLRQGCLDPDGLPRLRGIFQRFLRTIGGGSSAAAERVAQRLADAIDDGPRGLDLPALPDDAADRAPAAPPSGSKGR